MQATLVATGAVPMEERQDCASALDRIPGVFFPHRALRNLMVVAGLHYFRGSQSCRRSCICPPARIYATILLILAWTNFARHCTIFISDHKGIPLFSKLLSTSFFGMCCLNLTIFHYQSYHGISLCSFMHQLQVLAFDITRPVSRKLRRRSVAYTAAVGILTLCNVIYSTYAVFFAHLYVGAGTPFDAGGIGYEIMKVISVVIQFWYMQYWSIPMAMCHYMSLSIRDQFLLLNDQCKKSFIGDLDSITDFEAMRRRHRDLCSLVKEGDRLLCPFIAVNFAINTFVVCFIMYELLQGNSIGDDFISRAICFYWFLTTVINLSSYCIGPALVNSAAHAVVGYLHNIDLGTTSSHTLQMTMFLNKVCTFPIGFSCLGIFVVDMASIFTILGLIVTYLALLIEFQSESTPAQCDVRPYNITN